MLLLLPVCLHWYSCTLAFRDDVQLCQVEGSPWHHSELWLLPQILSEFWLDLGKTFPF